MEVVKIHYSLVSNDGVPNITVFHDGNLLQAGKDHRNWDAILEGVLADDESVYALFDVAAEVSNRFNKLSERVSVSGGHVYLDNEPVDDALTNQILKFLDEDLDFTPLVSFFEQVATNPSEHSKGQLYNWLAQHDFAITDDGSFIAYKGVKKRDDNYFSISHGTAIVNGEKHSGAIPNPVGAVVEMPRSEVAFDPTQGCSYGLHAGTWSYASSFAQGATLKVKINPRDVVSVPSDCNAQKLRVCRYTVLDVTDAPLASSYYSEYVDTDDDDDNVDYWGEQEDVEEDEVPEDEANLVVADQNGSEFARVQPNGSFFFTGGSVTGGSIVHNTAGASEYVLRAQDINNNAITSATVATGQTPFTYVPCDCVDAVCDCD